MLIKKNAAETHHKLLNGLSRRSFMKMSIGSTCVIGLGLVADSMGLNLVGTKAYAQDENALLAENSAGEGTYIPEETLGESDNMGDVPAAFAANGGITVNEIQGATRYETAAKEALAAFSSSSWALVACGESYADSLAAGALAGALECPILLSNINSVPSATTDALSSLGVSNIIMLGGTDVLTTNVGNQLKKIGNVSRLSGPTRYETQLKIFDYGNQKGYWSGDTVIIATGEDFADALAASPLSYSLKAPIFFCDKSGVLPSAQKAAIEGFFNRK